MEGEPIPRIRAARYIRMSTEHQRYSLANQRAAIDEYAEAHGYEIVRTYADAGKSGVTIHNRAALQKLLADVLSDETDFTAILVLDISRWGRFQDPDQAAHYEFICRRAGFDVTYCAEPFPNDQSFFNSVAKTLKRVMAGEYSRELSERVGRAHRLQAQLGFWQGGPAPYGIARMVVDASGDPVGILPRGESKAMTSQRVVPVPGPPEEIKVVREIFRLYVREAMSLSRIVRHLNDRGTPYPFRKGAWGFAAVRHVLTNELLIGRFAYGRSSKTLLSPVRPTPPEEWVVAQVFPPIVPVATFRKAQTRIAARKYHIMTDRELLAVLKKLWRRHGYLSTLLMRKGGPTPATYRLRFGSIQKAYELVGFRPRRTPGARPSDETILEGLKRIHDRHGRISSELIVADPAAPSLGAIRERFGGLRAAYARAGLPQPRGGRPAGVAFWSEELMLERLRELHRTWGYVSSSLVIHSPRTPSRSLYSTKLGGIAKACRQAGLPVTPRKLRLAAHRTRQIDPETLRAGEVAEARRGRAPS